MSEPTPPAALPAEAPNRLGGREGAPRGVVPALLLALSLLVLGASLALLARAAEDPARTGRLTAFFPPGWPAEARLAALLQAGVLPVRESWIPGAVEVEAASPGAAARLRAAGARLVLPGLPSNLLALGGCSGGSLADYPDRPNLRKLRAGPM